MLFPAVHRLALLFCIFVTSFVRAQQPPIPLEDALQRAEIPLEAAGMYVQEVGNGPVLFASNWDTPFNPASTMKLVTTSAALELLGPAFRWNTQAYFDGQQQGDVLHGDLIIKGSGDPKLVIEHFTHFLRRIRGKGIREIRGSVVLDRSAFRLGAFDPAEFDGDPMKPHNAGPDALLLNFKAMALRFVPDDAQNLVHVLVEPPMAGYAVQPPYIANGDCGDWRTKLRPIIDATGARFPGVFSASCGERVWYIHPHEMTPTQYFSAVFRRVWTELGGSLHGEIRDGLLPPTARLVTEWQSAPVAEVIRDVNKHSNNVMARQLLLSIAHQVLQVPATPEYGAAVVRTWLSNKGIDAPELSIDNGSGLSRSERVSALTLGRVLAAAYRSPYMPEFISSLSLVGHDGTMRNRLRGNPVAGRAHIKTGMLREVRAIAGYVLASSGKRYVVVCLINHPNAYKAHEVQDALLQWVHDWG